MTRNVHKVRTTRRPDLVIEVDDATLLDLTRRGQLLPLDEEPVPASTETTDEPDPEPVTEPVIEPPTRRRRVVTPE